jgi:hypothetical protein
MARVESVRKRFERAVLDGPPFENYSGKSISVTSKAAAPRGE